MIHKNGVTKTEDESEKTHATFSLRIPMGLAKQIDGRIAVSKRSRNKEIELMLERQIEAEVEKDRLLIEKMATMNLAAPQSNPS